MYVDKWKAMITRIFKDGSGGAEFEEWMADCALHAFEDGDVGEDVQKMIEENEAREAAGQEE